MAAVSSSQSPTPLHVEILESLDDFLALSDQYAALGAHDPPRLPFSSARWLAAWWHAYGRRGAVRVYCVFGDDRRLVAVVPLLFERSSLGRVPCTVASYLGSEWGEIEIRHARLSDDTWIDDFVHWIRQDAPAWNVFRLGPHESSEPTAQRLGIALGRHLRHARHETACPILILGRRWDQFAQGRSKNFRRTFKRKQSAAAEAGLSTRRVIDPSLDVLRATAGGVSQESWQGQRGVALLSTEEGMAFYDVLARTSGEFNLDLHILEEGDRCIGYLLGVCEDNVFHAFDTGYLPAFAELSPGALLHYSAIRTLCDAGVQEFRFGFAQPYKERFDPQVRTVVRVDFYSSAAVAALADAVRWVKRWLPASGGVQQKRTVE